ncbi:MAG: hypothetical protein CMJ81_22365 [Planctomycetaceae bacterium]|nr:hypothetical protein [Planctomycetaceae bacterium]MBP62282.1 hypothetical protein [Planctomycetaceae bacterium]
MDPLRTTIALIPLVVYAAVLGLVNMNRRSTLCTGTFDTIALGLGITGLVVIGPLELFYPNSYLMYYGVFFFFDISQWVGIGVWILLIMFYWLIVIWIALSRRPRLVIYNLEVRQLHRLLEQLLLGIDPGVRWAGETAVLPNLGIHFTIEANSRLRCIQLVSAGPRQDPLGWKLLRKTLRDSLKQERSPLNPLAFGYFLIALAMSLRIFGELFGNQQQLHQALLDLLRI